MEVKLKEEIDKFEEEQKEPSKEKTKLQEIIVEHFRFVNEFSWLNGSHNVGFFTSAVWDSFPKDWRSLQEVNISDLINIINYPTNLFPFLKDVFMMLEKLSLNRQPIQIDKISFSGEITRGMNEKQQKQLTTLVPFINSLAQKYEIQTIIDVGSGQGYLDRLLASIYPYQIIAIEKQEQNSLVSIQRSQGMNIQHIQQLFSKELLPDSGQQFLMCSLHACGDLSAQMIRSFVEQNDKSSLLANIGCCYNLIKTQFPLSNKLKTVEAQLTRIQLMVANQALERWDDQSAVIQAIQQNYFRSLFQFAIVDQGRIKQDEEVSGLGKLPKSAFEKFESYCIAATNFLHMEPLINVDKYQSELFFRRYAAFFILKCLFGTVIEDLILVDRKLYLQENGFQCDIIPIFTQSQSPRNTILVASQLL